MKPITPTCSASLLARLLLAGSIILSPLHGSASSSNELPEIGGAADSLLSPAEEKRLGQSFMRYIRSSEAVIDDPLLEDYINHIGNDLVNHSEGQGGHFKFFLIDDPEINAFAGPYGYIGVNTGLITTTETESELAAVLAHEITHVNQHHLFRAWHAASSMNVAQAAILLAAIALGAAAGGDAGLAAASAGQAAIAQGQINFTRGNEEEADRIGIQVLADSGYEPRAMSSFFARMGRANQYYATQLPEFLLTHPVTTARIADAQGRAEDYPHRQHANDLRYQLSRAAIRERGFSNPEDAVDYFEKTLEDGRYQRREADEYGYLLALLRDRQLEKAAKLAEQLLAQRPQSLEYLVANARVMAESGQIDKGIQLLERALPQFPLSYPLLIEASELYIRDKRPETAYKLLKNLELQSPGDMRVYALLARASADKGDQIRSHEYLGLHYYYSGALKSAEQQLKIALRQKNIDYYDTSRIETKMRSIRAEIDALEEKKKKR